jgi:hypothetical protein
MVDDRLSSVALYMIREAGHICCWLWIHLANLLKLAIKGIPNGNGSADWEFGLEAHWVYPWEDIKKDSGWRDFGTSMEIMTRTRERNMSDDEIDNLISPHITFFKW